MAVTGLAIGWRIRGSVAEATLAFALMLVFGFGMIWFGILIGSLMRSVEAVNGVMFTVLFPITFLANTFAPTEPMAHWLRVIAEWNPVSSLAQAMRELWGNGPPAPASAQLPLHHPVLCDHPVVARVDRSLRAVRAAGLHPPDRRLIGACEHGLCFLIAGAAGPLLHGDFGGAGCWTPLRIPLTPTRLPLADRSVVSSAAKGMSWD